MKPLNALSNILADGRCDLNELAMHVTNDNKISPAAFKLASAIIRMTAIAYDNATRNDEYDLITDDMTTAKRIMEAMESYAETEEYDG